MYQPQLDHISTSFSAVKFMSSIFSYIYILFSRFNFMHIHFEKAINFSSTRLEQNNVTIKSTLLITQYFYIILILFTMKRETQTNRPFLPLTGCNTLLVDVDDSILRCINLYGYYNIYVALHTIFIELSLWEMAKRILCNSNVMNRYSPSNMICMLKSIGINSSIYI